MLQSLNKVMLIGNIGSKPEIKKTAQGLKLCTFKLVTNDRKTRGNGETSNWHNIVLWNRLAEISAKMLRKGSRIWVEGNLRNRKYYADSKNSRQITEVVAMNMIILDSKEKRLYSNHDFENDEYNASRYSSEESDFRINDEEYEAENFTEETTPVKIEKIKQNFYE